MNTERLELAPLLARRELWLLVSTAFVDPYHRQRFAMLRDAEFRRRVLGSAALLAQEAPTIVLGPGEVQPKELSPQRLFDALEGAWPTVEATYRQVFGITATSGVCPACEVEYEPNPDITYRSQRWADIAGFYQAFGLQVSGRAGERLDHVSLQAEFLYVLLAKEAAALQEDSQEAAETCREARRTFFAEHVGWWLPAFSRLLSRAAPEGFYQELAALTASLSAAERDSLGLPPFQLRCVPRPAQDQALADCSGCMSP